MTETTVTSNHTKCTHCPLRKLESYRDFSKSELRFMEDFKTGELMVQRGSTIIVEGANIAHLYTVLSGLAFRYKILDDGRRQIMNYAVPGDLLGLQGNLTGEMQHSIEALSPLVLCVFQRDRIGELFKNHHTLAYDMTWLAAREESILDENLLSIGRRSAVERAAYLLAHLSMRCRHSGVLSVKNRIIPITQQHVADTLGLSIVHTNKTLKKLREKKLIDWKDRGCIVTDEDALADLAGWDRSDTRQRPFL